ncbi:MAG: transposase [Chloroflexota bacterium]
MRYDPYKHRRQSMRLSEYDYRLPGAYFVTICTEYRECIFQDEAVKALIEQSWRAVGKYALEATRDEFVVMPNHVHGIIWIDPRIGNLVPKPKSVHPVVEPGSLGAIVRAFKSTVTKRVNRRRQAPGLPVWQRGYHERIIRTDRELANVRQYIRDNPAKWENDPDNPRNGSADTDAVGRSTSDSGRPS